MSDRPFDYWVPARGTAGWQALLADPEKHWVIGRSARTLANCWEGSAGWPSEVAAALDRSDGLGGLQMLFGFPEYRVALPGGSRPSQTDLMVLARGPAGLVTIAVEGKVDESFGPLVSDWLAKDNSAGKERRLHFLADLLGLSVVQDLRYQLLHRTVSAVLEARRIGAADAVMLVHTWGGSVESFDDYVRFADRLGVAAIAGQTHLVGGSPRLHLGWVQGDPIWQQT